MSKQEKRKISYLEFDAACRVVNNIKKMSNPEHATEYMDEAELNSYYASLDIIQRYKEQNKQRVK